MTTPLSTTGRAADAVLKALSGVDDEDKGQWVPYSDGHSTWFWNTVSMRSTVEPPKGFTPSAADTRALDFSPTRYTRVQEPVDTPDLGMEVARTLSHRGLQNVLASSAAIVAPSSVAVLPLDQVRSFLPPEVKPAVGVTPLNPEVRSGWSVCVCACVCVCVCV